MKMGKTEKMCSRKLETFQRENSCVNRFAHSLGDFRFILKNENTPVHRVHSEDEQGDKYTTTIFKLVEKL